MIHMNSTQNSLFKTSVHTQNCFNNVKHCKQGQQEKAVPCADLEGFSIHTFTVVAQTVFMYEKLNPTIRIFFPAV